MIPMPDTPTSRRRAAPAVLLLAVLGSVAQATPAAAQDAPRVRAQAEHVGDGPRIWWNMKTYVEALGLSAEQRRGMDELFMAHRDARRQQAREYRQEHRAFVESLRRGDFAAARKASERLSVRTAELAKLASALKIDVIALLDAEQRHRLAEFPNILQRAWMMGGFPEGAGHRPGRGPNPLSLQDSPPGGGGG